MLDQLNQFSRIWWDWMAPMFWQVSLLVVIIGTIDFFIRKWAWPQVRYALWALVLVKLILPPSFTLSGSIVPNIRNIIENNTTMLQNEKVVLIPQSENQPNSSQLKSTEIHQTKKNISVTTADGTDGEALYVYGEFTWKFYLMVTWILGIIIFVTMLTLQIRKLKKWHEAQRKRKNIPEWFHSQLVKTAEILRIERLPAIVFSDKASSPAVYGVFRPVFLLPERYLDSLNEDEAEHILLHELAHVKRGDLLVHGICLFLQIFYWFNPFLIWARKQMKHVRELCCDITIANILREKTGKYRQTLVNTARELLTESIEPGMGLLGLFEEPFRLIARLKWLEKKTWESRSVAIFTALLISLLFAAFVLPMGELEIQPEDRKNVNKTESYNIINLKSEIELHTKTLNDAFINWNFEIIKNYYTDDIVLSEEGKPTIKGFDNVLREFRDQKHYGVKFRSLENSIADLWKVENDIYVVETFLYSLTLENINLDLSGQGKSITIWQIQNDGRLKIRYSILNLDNIIPGNKN